MEKQITHIFDNTNELKEKQIKDASGFYYQENYL